MLYTKALILISLISGHWDPYLLLTFLISYQRAYEKFLVSLFNPLLCFIAFKLDHIFGDFDKFFSFASLCLSF